MNRKTVNTPIFLLLLFCMVFPGCAKNIQIPRDIIKNNSVEKIMQAIENGADVNAKDEDGRTALMCAAWNNSLDVAEFLIKNGADVNTKSKYKGTALVWAKDKEYTEMINLLKKYGAE